MQKSVESLSVIWLFPIVTELPAKTSTFANLPMIR